MTVEKKYGDGLGSNWTLESAFGIPTDFFTVLIWRHEFRVKMGSKLVIKKTP